MQPPSSAPTRCPRWLRCGSRWATVARTWSSPTSSRSKSDGPTLAERRLEDLESVFAALAHEQRRHILLTLHFRGGQMSAGDIADRFACSWPTTTRHLRVLRAAGLVSVEKRGRERIYELDRTRLLAVAGGWLEWFAADSGK